MDEQKPARVKLGGVWKHQTKTGIEFMTGDLTPGLQIQIWPNKKREGKNDPDFVIWLGEKLKKEKPANLDSMVFPPASGDIPF